MIFKKVRTSASDKPKTISEAMISDISTDLSIKNNKERMRQFKNLSLKGNSLMDHIFSHLNSKILKAQSSSLFYSQKWDFATVKQKRQTESLKEGSKINGENPFFCAKLKHLNQQKSWASSRGSPQFKDDIATEFYLANAKTTMRLLKKRSLNQVLNKHQRNFQ